MICPDSDYFTPNKTKGTCNFIRALSWFMLLQFASLSRTLVFPDRLASTQDSTTAPIPSAGRRAPVVGTVVSVGCKQQGVDAAQGKAAKGTSSKPATTANRRGKSRGDEGQLNRTPLRHSDASVCVSRKNSSSSGLSPSRAAAGLNGTARAAKEPTRACIVGSSVSRCKAALSVDLYVRSWLS